MRKIIVLEFITLDGVMQGPGGKTEDESGNFVYGGWTVPFFDEESGKEMTMQMEGKYDLLLGRKTYDIFASYWPKHIEGWPQVNMITKYVMSKTLENPSWQNTKVLKSVEDLRKMKNGNGPDLQIYGSGNMVQTLFENDLVDELWLKIFPVTLGTGKKLFDKGTLPASYKLAKSKVTPSGVIFAYYRRDGEVKTGSF